MIYYIIIISLLSAVVTVCDKIYSKKQGHRRVPEKTLLLLGIRGGSLAMYVTMLIIRHKTRHIKFMLGLPAVMLAQAAAVIALFLKFGGAWIL